MHARPIPAATNPAACQRASPQQPAILLQLQLLAEFGTLDLSVDLIALQAYLFGFRPQVGKLAIVKFNTSLGSVVPSF
jgi:hypothetical protein